MLPPSMAPTWLHGKRFNRGKAANSQGFPLFFTLYEKEGTIRRNGRLTPPVGVWLPVRSTVSVPSWMDGRLDQMRFARWCADLALSICRDRFARTWQHGREERKSGGKGLQNLSDLVGAEESPSAAGSGEATTAAVNGSAVNAQSSAETAASGRTSAKRKSGAASGSGPTIDHLATSLRRAYESTLEEEVPDSIMDLLRQLD